MKQNGRGWVQLLAVNLLNKVRGAHQIWSPGSLSLYVLSCLVKPRLYSLANTVTPSFVGLQLLQLHHDSITCQTSFSLTATLFTPYDIPFEWLK